MLTDLEIGWFAGIIDGEGCIQAIRSNRSKGYSTGGSIATELRVEAVSLPMIDRIYRILDALDVRYKASRPRRAPNSTRDIHRVSVYRNADVKKVLTLVEPILVVKRAEAKTVLEWLERWPDQRGVNKERATFEEKEAYYLKLRELKKVA